MQYCKLQICTELQHIGQENVPVKVLDANPGQLKEKFPFSHKLLVQHTHQTCPTLRPKTLFMTNISSFASCFTCGRNYLM